jgi:hypothetical protein
MRSTKERLEQSVQVLDTLEARRQEMKTPTLGADTEWSLIEQELREIERDILEEPGALEKFLVRIRPNG